MKETEKSTGYRGAALKVIKKVDAEVGDILRITKQNETYEGILIPRSEYGDEKHIVLKLKTGYNVGISITNDTKIMKIGQGAKPTFTPPPLPKRNEKLPKVAIVSTGGTIASRVDYRTGAVRPALTASDLYSVVPELSNIALIDAQILFSLFSENMTTQNWTKLAETVAKHVAKEACGVVIAHGTDTMAYTAAAMSFALQDLPVPVMLVGAQRSADRPSSDAATNLIGAVTAAAEAPFAEVTLSMHATPSDKTIAFHRATKVRKCHTSRRDTFRSVNTEPIAKFQDGKIYMLTEDYMRRDPSRKLKLRSKFDEKVALIKFHPSMNPALIDWFRVNDYKGIILEGTGLGHVSKYCFENLKKAIDEDVLVGMTSQCIWGRVNMNVYECGRDLMALGIIPLGDMLPETALVKLMWIFGQTQNLEEAERLLKTNIAHEFSPRTLPDELSNG